MEHEVIIVGAGPAGAVAAICLAEYGRDVLLLDRHSFPRDKSCGDGIPPGSMEVLGDLGLEDEMRQAGFYPINNLLFATPGGNSLNAEFTPQKPGMEFFIAPRMQFDYLLQRHAVKRGAQFCQAQVTEPILSDGRVVGVRANINGENKEKFGRIIIGADGATSFLSRALSSPKKLKSNLRMVGVRAYAENVEILPNTVEFYWHKELLPGYAWIFPIEENKANIGVAIRVDRLQQKKQGLESLLIDFLKHPTVKERLKDGHLKNIKTWPLNLASANKPQCVFHGALLIGDAAFLVDPFSGEGIRNALVSARIAADVVQQALKNSDVSMNALRVYDYKCRKAFGKIFRRSYFLQLCMTHTPLLMDSFIKIAQANPKLADLLFNKLSTDFRIKTDG